MWSLVYPDEPKIPEVQNISWVNNSIDSFILEKIESQDLQPSDRANKHKLVRRAYLDLLGIPPTIEEDKQFTENQSPNAWEELIEELRKNYTIIIVTHSMQQAARVSQQTAFFHLGDLVEVGKTDDLFVKPQEQKTQDYITGRFG